MTVTILMPVYDDWRSAALVCAALDRSLAARPDVTARVLLVDDGSVSSPRFDEFAGPLRSLQSVELLRLRRNLGHQRAIAVGLVYLHQHRPLDSIVVMDSDGEDRPEDVIHLLAAFERTENRQCVFAERRRRVSGLTFKAGYLVFRLIHRVLTGHGIRIGNFSILPAWSVANLVVQSSLWSHYAATVVNGRLPMSTIQLDRGPRLSGSSRMNLVTLVAHGLSAVSVFREIVATRVLLASSALFLGGSALFVVLLTAVVRGTAAAPWIWMMTALLGVAVLQITAVALVFALATLASREQFSVLPARDCLLFVLEHRVVLERP
jgi:polyisoprenyl-phosphate glycosyltransferase